MGKEPAGWARLVVRQFVWPIGILFVQNIPHRLLLAPKVSVFPSPGSGDAGVPVSACLPYRHPFILSTLTNF